MSTTNVSNYTTLYSTTAGAVAPQQPYGNANVEAFLNAGTDGGNTVQNILANGNIVANGFFIGDGGLLSNITAYTNVIANTANVSLLSNVVNTNASSSSTFYPVFVDNAGNVKLQIDNVGNTLAYIPSSSALFAGQFDSEVFTNDQSSPATSETMFLDGSNNSIRMTVTGLANAVVIGNTSANVNTGNLKLGNITLTTLNVGGVNPGIQMANDIANANNRIFLVQGSNVTDLANVDAGNPVVAGQIQVLGGGMGNTSNRISNTTQNIIGGGITLSGGNAWGNNNSGRTVQGGGISLTPGRAVSANSNQITGGAFSMVGGNVNFQVANNITGGSLNLFGGTITPDSGVANFSANTVNIGGTNFGFGQFVMGSSNGVVGNIRTPLVNFGASFGLGTVFSNGVSNITVGNVTPFDQVYFRTPGVGGQSGVSQGNINNVAIGNITTPQIRMETGSWQYPGGSNVSNVRVTGNFNSGDILIATGATNNVTSVLGTITRGNVRLNGRNIVLEASTTSNSSPTGSFVFDANNTANLGNLVISNNIQTGNIIASNTIQANGNITTNNYIVANAANLTGTYDINSAGYYFPRGFPITSPLNYNPNIAGLNLQGSVTTGSNNMTGVVLLDRFQSAPLSLTDWQGYLPNQCVGYNTGVGDTTDLVFPIGTTITSVDAPNNTVYFSNNSSYTGGVNIVNGTLLSNASTQTYLLTQQPVIGLASATDATSNAITLSTMFPFAGLGFTTGAPIQFLGSTAFGNITIGTQYYVGNVDIANSQISISTSNTGTPDVQLTTATGNLLAAFELEDNTIKPLNGGYYYAGPWSTNPVTANVTNFTETPNSGLIGNITFTSTDTFVKPVDFNSNAVFPPLFSGQFTRVQNGLVVSDSEYGTSTLFGTLGDQFALNGVGVIKTGLEPNTANARTNMQIVNYTDNGGDSANITNPGNPPAFSFTAFTGNVNTNPNDTYLRSGRTIGRIGWYGAMQNNGVQYIQPGSSPVAGIYVQALGDWNNATNANIPMVMAFQYSPLNAAGSTPNYQRINRTFLQAANNTTTIGGATNIEFKPLARGTNATNNRSPSGLGNVSINPQTFVDISGYTQGNAVSNGAGALLNVTTTASTWNGNVALRFSRTVGNTANMEFQLPVNSANTLILRDNVTGNTIATFTNPSVTVNGNITSNNANLGNLATANFFQGDGSLLTNISSNAISATYGSFFNDNDIAITANTVANLDLPHTSANSGVSIASNNQITVTKAGTYNLQLSLQLKNTDNAADHDFDFWFAKNGTDIANSATQLTVVKNDGKNVAVVNFIDQCAANDYYQIRYAASSANISLETFPAITTPYNRPAIPSAIVTVVPVGS